MKKLDRLILRSYFGPLLLTFSISMFVLVLQFLWRKIETLIGKGLEFSVILEMFAYASATLVPMALPLSILLASIMTMGNFGERYELVAMKSAGISLWRIFRPLIISSVLFSILAFYFSNNIMPTADMRLKQIVYDVKNKKPTINIRPNEFYDEISNYVIRVNDKDSKTNVMRGILIYNHSKGVGNCEVIKADSGYMSSADKGNTMLFTLYNGEVYSEEVKESAYGIRPVTRIDFHKQVIRFDVSDFEMEESSDDKYSDFYKVMDVQRLSRRMDSLSVAFASSHEEFIKRYQSFYLFNANKDLASYCKDTFDFYSDYKNLTFTDRDLVDRNTSERLFMDADEFVSFNNVVNNDAEYLRRHEIEFYRKFTLSLACLILLFIGAPLGAIIRKGGLGLPVVVSILAFVVYYVIGELGAMSAKSGSITPVLGMWLSTIIFLPLGIILTLKATR